MSGQIHKPTENDGLTIGGEEDQRLNKPFAGGKVDPVEAGKQGGQASAGSHGEQHKPTKNDGKKVDGTADGRVKGN